MARRETELMKAPETDDNPEAYKAGTPLEKGKISESDQVQLFHHLRPQQQPESDASSKFRPHPDKRPGYTVPRTSEHCPRTGFRKEQDHDVKEGIEQIGGGEGESRDIDGRPITPADAKLIQRKEVECGYGTGKGSLAARAQSAAAANVRDGVVEEDAGRSATLS